MDSILVTERDLKGQRFQLELPSSKSLANRSLILAALTRGEFDLSGDFQAEDIQLMIGALQQLGVQIEQTDSGVSVWNDLSWRENADEMELFLGNSGTSVRFLTTLVALRAGTTVLTGKERMKERPIGDLVVALRQLGIEIEYLENDGFPPLRVVGTGTVSGGSVSIKGDVSSQFLTSLLLCGSSFNEGLKIQIDGELISKPYVEMTLKLLEKWGGQLGELADGVMSVENAQLKTENRIVEGDASAAVYWWALSYLQQCQIDVLNLPPGTAQGDRKFKSLLWYVNSCYPCTDEGFDFFMGDMPDAALMLMALAPLTPFRTRITGIGSLRVKETDRIEAMATELTKLGVTLEAGADWMLIYPLDLKAYDYSKPIQIETYDDHRVAMSMAIIGTKLGNLEILDPNCVDKSYPAFWDDLDKMK